MYYTVYKDVVLYIALAKKTPFVNGYYLHEPGTVWFEYGETKEEALDNLKEELPGNDWIEWEKEEKT